MAQHHRINHASLVKPCRNKQQTTLYSFPHTSLHHIRLFAKKTCTYLRYKMPERRPVAPSTSSSRSIGVRRNLFHHQLSRRPTTSSTSTSAETLRLDPDPGSDTSDIVIRDQNGDFAIGDPLLESLDEQEEGEHGDAHEDESTDANEFGW